MHWVSQQRLDHHKHPWTNGDGKGDRGEGGMTYFAREGVKAREQAVSHNKKAGLEFKHSKVFFAFEGQISFRENELLHKGIPK